MTHNQRGILTHGVLIFTVTCGLAMAGAIYVPNLDTATKALNALDVLAVSIVLAQFCRRRVWLFNLLTALGLVALAIFVGTSVSVNALLVIFTLASFYDIVAVYVTGHMVRMFRALKSRGIVLAFVLPEAKYLGTGDVALPAMLAVAAAQQGLVYGLAVTLGAMIGYWLMLRLSNRRPMPAFPPIALGASLLYLVSLILVP